ncbi:Smr/MutS family protein [Methylobacterium sp. J-090]|uniref:Smr/MutS family protein n=1 Tax=Methylobacterium sp. J-090 TaxID=2836666 RepID=UPI001FBB035D|nr:Smr/MutS family protein [Methylobacterium sp. J-090]MCJ2084370.1 Smr/MutS family protein [Methylobacterium sp. J-090]
MRPPRRPRGLSGEDAYLWGEIARLITPLRARTRPAKAKPADAPVGTPPKIVAAIVAKPAHKAVAEVAAKPPVKLPVKPPAKRVILKPSPPPPAPAPVIAPPPLAPGLERRVRLAFRRGALQVDARIDLHGMYQAEAHGALTGFLMRARAAGHTHVLVVTGKGGIGKGGLDYDDAFSERGVLRRSVPHWLRAPELRGFVLGFEEAARHHGGAGALYVRLRRR